MNNKIFLAVLMAMACHGAQAAMVWQPAPPEPKQQSGGGAHQGHGAQRGGKPFLLQEAEGAEAQMWLPTRVRRPLHLNDEGRVSIGGTGLDNFHLLYAEKSSATGEEVAMRYLYQHGKPSGESPSSLIEYNKAALDIVPAPLTREHQRYTSRQSFHFILRFNGQPLATQPVVLTTSNGSELKGKTDANGRITLQLPDDFSDVKPGRSNNRPAEFVVTSLYEDNGRQYRTTLSAAYYVNPSHWRSTTGGLVAMFAGMATGLVVLRRSRRDTGNDKKGRA